MANAFRVFPQNEHFALLPSVRIRPCRNSSPTQLQQRYVSSSSGKLAEVIFLHCIGRGESVPCRLTGEPKERPAWLEGRSLAAPCDVSLGLGSSSRLSRAQPRLR